MNIRSLMLARPTAPRGSRFRGLFPAECPTPASARLVFTTGFVLCLLLTLIKFLDFSPGGMAIFGFLTFVFFLLLMRTPRKRLPTAAATWARSQVETTLRDNSGPARIRETFAQRSSNCFHALHLPVRNDSIRTCVH